ncbi:hypothetical protein M407DRAFT_16056 [Tulasnella calospora MUT 4182]|uniref:Uncharacterized protein n=1 Tax=Tulasnella calospora MUT 4182 TaxID=1051891 RepID=A0A0C3PXS9_9AGAM|nr:hypothetical protein M407DRAFT_16056 [Tulasnella calospora MUT 4182]
MSAPRHKAVILHPPARDIRLEEVEGPKITDPDDVIVKVTVSCRHNTPTISHIQLSSALWAMWKRFAPLQVLSISLRHTGSVKEFIMGHELVGEVVALGSSYGNDVASRPLLYSTLRIGDKVISPFTVSCGECDNCALGFSARCAYSKLLGSPSLSGAQAQYIRIPKAGGTLVVVDPNQFSGIPDPSLLLMADILPTGYFAVRSALRHPNLELIKRNGPLRIAVVGLGPVGLCALVGFLDSLAEGLWDSSSTQCTILAVDPSRSRRERASHVRDAVTCRYPASVEYLSPDEANEWKAKNGGVHAVCEMVGNNSALRLAYDLIRPFGVISSIGVHTAPNLPFTGGDLYDKNVSLSFGRCPVRSIFDEALEVLKRWPEVFGVGNGKIIDKVIGFGAADGSDVRRTYAEFDEGICGKVVFDPWKE